MFLPFIEKGQNWIRFNSRKTAIQQRTVIGIDFAAETSKNKVELQTKHKVKEFNLYNFHLLNLHFSKLLFLLNVFVWLPLSSFSLLVFSLMYFYYEKFQLPGTIIQVLLRRCWSCCPNPSHLWRNNTRMRHTLTWAVFTNWLNMTFVIQKLHLIASSCSRESFSQLNQPSIQTR